MSKELNQKIIERTKKIEDKKKSRNPASGITLIALVITIIVILILAGVSIMTLMGENGLIAKTIYAKKQTEIGEEKDKIQVAILADKTDELGGAITLKGLQDGLKQEATVEAKGEGYKITFNSSERGYVIDKNGNIIEIYEPGEDNIPETEQIGEWTKLNKVSKTGGFDSSKGVNAPNLGSELTAVTLTDDIADYTSNGTWYNYVEQTGSTESGGTSKWANAVTTDEDGAVTGYYVWIPRYAYRIARGYHGEGLSYDGDNVTTEAGTIEIKFLKDATNEFADGTGTAETDPSKINYTNGEQDKWLVHPAFLSTASIGGGFGSKSGNSDGITGIWIAKFEISAFVNTDTTSTRYISSWSADERINLRVLPGVQSTSMANIGTMYELAYNMNRNAESHMLKNSEWGAMAYLAHSSYGRNGTEITINDTRYAVQDPTDSSTDAYTGGSNTKTGYLNNGIQSTTGNAYGIYDVNGGKWEYVASYINNGSESLTTEGGTMTSSNRDASSPYKTVYKSSPSDTVDAWSTDIQIENYGITRGMKGDAIYETSLTGQGATSWKNDYSEYPFSEYPFFLRGGDCNFDPYAGAFSFTTGTGSGTDWTYGKFRSCLVLG